MTPQTVYNLSRLKSISGTAAFSPDKTYRYLLTREWGYHGRAINFLLCNPSTATAKELDPTVAKCLYWAILWGFDTLLITNVFALRSTNPAKLYEAGDPIGPENDEYISMAMQWAANSGGMVVCGFGNHGKYLSRNLTIQAEAATLGINLFCLSVNNKSDIPTHPLYIKKSAVPMIWKYACVPASINVIQE